MHTEDLPARQARHARLAAPLAPAVAAALQLRGVRQLFLHQAEAVGHLLQARPNASFCVLHTATMNTSVWHNRRVLQLFCSCIMPKQRVPRPSRCFHPPLQGRHTVVATSTASGKSLCYLVPILQALAQVVGRRGGWHDNNWYICII